MPSWEQEKITMRFVGSRAEPTPANKDSYFCTTKDCSVLHGVPPDAKVTLPAYPTLQGSAQLGT